MAILFLAGKVLFCNWTGVNPRSFARPIASMVHDHERLIYVLYIRYEPEVPFIFRYLTGFPGITQPVTLRVSRHSLCSHAAMAGVFLIVRRDVAPPPLRTSPANSSPRIVVKW